MFRQSVRALVMCGSSVIAAHSLASGAILSVGPGKPYSMPCAAITAAKPGDIVEIDAAGNYSGNVCTISTSNLTIRGINGRPVIDAAGNNAQGKGTWVISGNDTIVDNIEMSGAKVTAQNGAAIRQEGTNVTIRNCYFHDNENGILSSPNLNSSILIENSEFARNGYGDGYTHNIYIGNVAKFTLQFSYSHLGKVGHLVKTRAAQNYILYNRITDETGTASYELDVPNGGRTYVIGNLFQQAATTSNPSILGYMLEGAATGNPSHELYVVNNTFVNSRGSGTFININTADTTPAVIQNNIFTGGGTVVNQAAATLTTNYTGAAAFVNAAAYDYRLAGSGTGIVDAGTMPGSASGYSLVPVFHYVHPTCSESRTSVGVIDIGAYELNGGGGTTTGCATNNVAPTLNSVALNPTSAVGGATTTSNAVTLTGTAGPQAATVNLTSSDLHAAVPATVTIPAGASSAPFTIGTTSVSAAVTATITASYGGSTASAALTINPPAPVLASVKLAGTAMTAGTTLTGNLVTLSAAAPAGGALVTLGSGSSAVLSVPASVTVPAGATSATFSITAGSVTSSTSVSVTGSYGGASQSAFISVNPPAASAPAISSISPSSATAGSAVAVMLTGSGFQAGSTVAVTGTGVTASSVQVVSATQLKATFTVASSATSGARTVTVAGSSGTSNGVTFTVQAASALPTLSSITPNRLQAGTSVTVTLTGTNLNPGATVVLDGQSIKVSNIVVINSTTMTALFSLPKGLVPRTRSVKVTTSAGTSNAVSFTSY